MRNKIKKLRDYIDSNYDDPLCFQSAVALTKRGRLNFYTLMEKPEQGNPYLHIRPLEEPDPFDKTHEPVRVFVKHHLDDKVVE